MQAPSPYQYTEDALRGFILDCLEVLKQPVCPNVFSRTYKEYEMWAGMLEGLTAERNTEAPGLVPVEG